MMPFVYVPMSVDHLGLIGGDGLPWLAGRAGHHRRLPLGARDHRGADAVFADHLGGLYGWLFFDETLDLWTAVGSAVIIASGIYIVLREGTPRVSQNTPVLESRTRMEIGTQPRISSWLKRFERSGDQA